ncbi:MAG TPA: hypothetical protein VM260_22040, partial [Pirellula sp.]|nr:hypothetical protein [Pirellula sp.]
MQLVYIHSKITEMETSESVSTIDNQASSMATTVAAALSITRSETQRHKWAACTKIAIELWKRQIAGTEPLTGTIGTITEIIQEHKHTFKAQLTPKEVQTRINKWQNNIKNSSKKPSTTSSLPGVLAKKLEIEGIDVTGLAWYVANHAGPAAVAAAAKEARAKEQAAKKEVSAKRKASLIAHNTRPKASDSTETDSQSPLSDTGETSDSDSDILESKPAKKKRKLDAIQIETYDIDQMIKHNNAIIAMLQSELSRAYSRQTALLRDRSSLQLTMHTAQHVPLPAGRASAGAAGATTLAPL